MPRFVSLKASTANVRRGPGQQYRIDWQYLHRGTPFMVVAEFDNWRKVEDVDGIGGWVHFRLLDGRRTALVTEDSINLQALPTTDSAIVAVAQRGALPSLSECTDGWCLLSGQGAEGWVPDSVIWGGDADLPD